MTAFSANNQNIITSGGVSECEWTALTSRADLSDFKRLSHTLLSESIDTNFHIMASYITTDWLFSLHKKQQYAANRIAKVSAFMQKGQPIYNFIKSLSSDKKSFIDKLFEVDTTLFVLSTNNADDICVISRNPTTENTYEYPIKHEHGAEVCL